VPKKAYSIRLKEPKWKILEELGKEIARQTPYPEQTVTQLIERAIEDYMGRLSSENDHYKEVILRISDEFARSSSGNQKTDHRRKGKVLQIKDSTGRGNS